MTAVNAESMGEAPEHSSSGMSPEDRSFVSSSSTTTDSSSVTGPDSFSVDSVMNALPDIVEIDENTHPAALGLTVTEDEFDEDMHHPASIEFTIRSIQKASELKAEGNSFFAKQRYFEAAECYTEALKVCPSGEEHAYSMAVFHNNRAACYLHLGRNEEAIEDTTASIELAPRYVKAYMRRAKAYEEMDKLEEALQDLKSVLEIDPSIAEARTSFNRIEKIVKERQEKMKEEMLGKLKDMGNMLLGKFGLSTDNFKFEQDPNTGSYNVRFEQNPKQ